MARHVSKEGGAAKNLSRNASGGDHILPHGPIAPAVVAVIADALPASLAEVQPTGAFDLQVQNLHRIFRPGDLEIFPAQGAFRIDIFARRIRNERPARAATSQTGALIR